MTRKNWNAPIPGQPAYIVTGPRGAFLARFPFGPGGPAAEETAKAAAHNTAAGPAATVTRYSGVTAHSFVWIVTGESDSVSGVIVSAHATEACATAKAVALINVLLGELELPADATPENWRDRVETLEDATSGGSYVSLESFPLEA